MPNASKETASEHIALEGIDIRLENFDGGYSVCFESHTADADLAGACSAGCPTIAPSFPAGAT